MVCVSALCNALWTALSQRRVREISAISFAIAFRAWTALLLLPFFIYGFDVPREPLFWAALIGSGVREGAQVVLLSAGVRRDYYAAYSMYNTAPLFIILFAPRLLHESIGPWLVVGAVLIVGGGLTFYRVGGFSTHGLLCAVLSAIGAILNKMALWHSTWLFFPFLQVVIAVAVLLPWGLRGRRREDLRATCRRPGTLLLMALLSSLAAIAYYSALQVTPATRVAPLWRINLLFAFLISYFILRERDDWQYRLVGGGLILVGCVLVSVG
ncbi:MAG: EamA family transporter [Armatimonadota bacterium]